MASFWSVHRSTIVDAWIARVFDEYPGATRVFLGAETDPFRNPVGAAVRDALPRLYDQIVGDMNRDALLAALDDIIRVRIVQDLPSAGAAGFVLELKAIARDAAGDTRMTEPAQESGRRARVAEVCPGCGAGKEGLASCPAGFRIAPSYPDTVEERIDRAALLAADVLARCQRDLTDVRANEERRQVAVLQRRRTATPHAGTGRHGSQAH